MITRFLKIPKNKIKYKSFINRPFWADNGSEQKRTERYRSPQLGVVIRPKWPDNETNSCVPAAGFVVGTFWPDNESELTWKDTALLENKRLNTQTQTQNT